MKSKWTGNIFINQSKTIIMKVLAFKESVLEIEILEGFAKGYKGTMNRFYFDGPFNKWYLL